MSELYIIVNYIYVNYAYIYVYIMLCVMLLRLLSPHARLLWLLFPLLSSPPPL